MSHPAPLVPFDEWALAVDALCRHHLACSWDDLCGDIDMLRRGHELGEAPLPFVRWFAEKYDLFWRDPADKWNPWT